MHVDYCDFLHAMRAGCYATSSYARTRAVRYAAINMRGTRSPLKNIRARGRIIFLFFPRAPRARAR
jgi:hypothetical protein